MTESRLARESRKGAVEEPGSRFRRAVWKVVSAYNWVVLVTNTLGWYTVCWILTPWVGRRRGFGVGLQMWGRSNMRGGFFSCHVEGLENLRQPAVLIANHRSIFDICLLSAILPRPYYFVSRKEVLKVPFIGSVLKEGGHVLIDRGKGTANEPKLTEAAERAAGGGRVVFFPEGTRSTDLKIRRFKRGAFLAAAEAGVPVVPTAIAGTELTVPKHSAYIIPARMAIRFMEPVMIDHQKALSQSFREEIRAAVESEVIRLQSFTRHRV